VQVTAGSSDWGWFGSGDHGPDDITDDQGAFRISRLEPGRYNLHAKSPHGLGESAGSTLVGLGEHVEGVTVKLHAGMQVSGTVVLPNKQLCEKPSVGLTEPT